MSLPSAPARTGPARTEVLARIADALGPAPAAVDVPRDYDIDPPADVDLLERFVDRVEDYRATVHRVGSDDLAATIGRILAAAVSDRVARVVVAHDLDEAVLPEGVERHIDSPEVPLPVDGSGGLDAMDAVVTTSAAAIADTGTIVLDGGPGQGRRAITLVPDLHVCIVDADDVHATVPLAVRALDATRPQTWISGPSATSDIELDRVEGVHGPRTLHVVLLT